jgi:hypothetical protein
MPANRSTILQAALEDSIGQVAAESDRNARRWQSPLRKISLKTSLISFFMS